VTKHNGNKTNESAEQSGPNSIDLDSLYAKRKANHQAPADLKQSVFASVDEANKDAAPWWHFNLSNYTSFAKLGALTACLAILVLVVGVQMIGNQLEYQNQPYANKPNTALVYRSIQIHVINHGEDDSATSSTALQDPQVLIANSKEQRVIYRREFNQLLAEQKTLATQKQSIAQVLQYNGDLQLLTCQNDLLNITEEVVNLLEPNSAAGFSEGQMLALRFDDNGHIIDMQVNSGQTQCYS
jgi:hypothetical protein